MSRIKNYQIDTAITGGDKLVGSDIGDNNSTKLYSIGGIAEFYSKTGDADGAKIGLQYQYAGKYENNAIHAKEFRYAVDNTAPQQFGWSNITAIAFSKKTISLVDISPMVNLLLNQNIKITNSAQGGQSNYAIYAVGSITNLSDAFLLNLTHAGSSGTPALDSIAVAAMGVPDVESDKFFTFNQPSASSVWNIQHNLAKFPSVSVVDSANNIVQGFTTYLDNNNLTISFTSAFSGKAYLN
jgi:hypothetical protein